MMMRTIAILLLAVMGIQSTDNSTMTIMEGPSPLPSTACINFSCPSNEVCTLKEVVCVKEPCDEVPTCIPRGPSCITIKCTANTSCVDLPTGSVCLPNGSNSTIDPCSTMKCGNGTICKVHTVNCLVPPCPPLAQCVAPSTGPSCMTMKCTANTTCDDLPTGSVCQPNANSTNPCAAMLCAVGSVCEVKTVNCIRSPCPPIGTCVPRTTNSSSCLHIKCTSGFECRNGDKGEFCYPVSTPQTDLCANFTCPSNQSCSVLMVDCLVAPCPPPKPYCRPSEAEDPCKVTECNKGFFCVAMEGQSHCLRSSGSSCASTSCAINTTCIDYKEGAVCIESRPSSSNLTCATVKCAANTTCVILPSGPVCIPSRGENPCNSMECAKGFFCVVQQGEPSCIAHSGSSCAATSCPSNTTCLEFPQGAACIEGIISGGCANITCGGKSQCKETMDGPRCYRGGKRDDRILDIHGCGRGEQHSECMPQCEDTCRGIETCDLSIPASNSSIWTNSTSDNSTSLPSQCISGCICRDHFKRNVQGNCVPNNRCWLTPGCRENESWTRCRGCEPTCSNPTAGEVCTAVCQSGCGCNDGFVRSKRGLCVLPEDCRAVDLINGDQGNGTIAIEG